MGSSAPGAAGREAVRDYIRAELRRIGASEAAPTKKARKRRAFLVEQLQIASGVHPIKVKLDTALVRAARESAWANAATEAPALVTSGAERVPGDGERPPYWAGCEGMGFDELRGFVEEALRRRRYPERFPGEVLNDGGFPRLKEEFMDLVGLLRRKMDEWRPPVASPTAPPAPAAPPAAPKDPVPPPPGSFGGSARLAAMRDENERLAQTVREMVKDPAVGWERIGELRREMGRRMGEIRAAEAAEREGRARKGGERRPAPEGTATGASAAAAARKAALRTLRRSKAAHDRARPRRALVCASLRHDIERAFAGAPAAPIGVPTSGRLPWRPLPPGELTREGVRAHYKRLAREHPERRYEPERIEKALSLGPSRWWEGLDDFGGYAVFEYPGTEKVLVECAVYGNAIYVIGADWKRLSRLSKRELLASRTRGVTKIVHKGDWFLRTKRALGL